MIEGLINGASFLVWVEDFLIPKNELGSIVVDILGSHKGSQVLKLLEAMGIPAPPSQGG